MGDADRHRLERRRRHGRDGRIERQQPGSRTAGGPVTDDAAGASPDEALADKAEEDAVSAEKSTPGASSGSRPSTTSTTEKVPPKAAKKAKAEGEAGRTQARKTT